MPGSDGTDRYRTKLLGNEWCDRQVFGQYLLWEAEMKKIIVVLFLLLLFGSTASADDFPLSIVSDNLYFFNRNFACYNALAVNAGENDISPCQGELKLYNEFGTAMESLEINAVSPVFLQPEGYTYYSGCVESQYFSEENQPADYSFGFQNCGFERSNTQYHVLYSDDVSVKYDGWSVLFSDSNVKAAFTNPTDKFLSDYRFVIALYDGNRNLLHVQEVKSFHEDVRFIIHPGSTVTALIPYYSYYYMDREDETNVPVYADALLIYEDK